MTTKLLSNYLQFDPNSDLGEYICMYNNLPQSLENLCDLIQKQLVHPWNGSPHLDHLRSLQMTHKQLQGLQSAWPIFEKLVYK